MALTEAQEKELLEGLSGLKKSVTDLSAVAAKVPELEAQIKAKDTKIAELEKGHQNLSQQADRSGLKTAYPDVPEHLLDHALSLPADKRADFLKPTQEAISKVKGALPNTDPRALDPWARAGGIGPTDDAAIAAEKAAQDKARQEARSRGDVAGMIQSRGKEVTEFLRRSIFAKA